MTGHLEELAKIRDSALARRSFSSAVNAEIARGKVGGLYVDQKKILSLTGKIDSLDAKELEDKFMKLVNDHSSLIGDVDIKQIKDKIVDHSTKKSD